MNIAPLLCPLDAPADEAVNELCEVFTRATLSVADDRKGSNSSLGNTGSAAWRPELGVLHLYRLRSKACDDKNFVNAQCRILRYLSCTDNVIELDCLVEHPLTFGGVQVAPGKVSISGNSRSAEVISTGSKASWKIERLDEKLPIWAPSDAVKIKSEGFSDIPCVQGSEWYRYWVDPNLADASVKEYNAPISDFVSAMEDTLNAINEYIPEYRGWVGLLLREVSPLPLVKDGSESGSFRFFPGHIKISTPHNVGSGISNLIHECSHQYLHLLEWTCSTVRKDVEEYSVLKDTSRPLSKILLGFHALSNALIALTIAEDRGIRDKGFLEIKRHVQMQAKSLRASVRSAGVQNLSEVGKSIFHPLDDTVSELL